MEVPGARRCLNLTSEREKMSGMKIGIAGWGITLPGADGAEILDSLKRAEELGVYAAWLATGPTSQADALTLLGGAVVSTQRMMLGTAVTPTWPRHPVVTGQQVQVLADLAPGRIRLGLGPGHQAAMEETFGVDFRAPLGHLREYVQILKALLQEGAVDFDGKYYKAHARIAAPVDVPVMISALQPRSFEMCGAEADGAISWVCPRPYLRDVALPAMKAAAEKAGRPVPPLIAHAPVCVHDDPEEARAAIREQVRSLRPGQPFYRRMFVAAGFPEAAEGEWSDAMIDATALIGNEAQVAEQMQELFDLGATEAVVSPLPAGRDHAASLERIMQMLAQASR